jgi:NADH:ubiquinone oxidoreductase subunit 6 (subunit J)
MISIQLILLIIFGLAAIWFGWRVFMTSSMVRSALSLLASMVAIGALFLVMEAEFLGVLQIMMMGTEMSIMAIFMMMYMMDPGGLGNMDMTHQKNVSIAAGVAVTVLVTGAAIFADWGTIVTQVPSPHEQNRLLGMEILKRSMMIFETAGVTILTGMIASIAVALSIKNNAKK